MKLVSILLLVLLAPTSVFAQQIVIGDWGKTSRGYALTLDVVGGAEREWVWRKAYSGLIANNASGERDIVISILENEFDLCSPKKLRGEDIARFQGQAVRVIVWCNMPHDMEHHSIRFTAKTDAGKSYVYNLFRSSSDPIKIEFLGESFSISPIGFKTEWEKAGGSVL